MKEGTTTLTKRVVFGIISLIIIAAFVQDIFAYSNGYDTPPMLHWLFFFGPVIVGFALTTLNAEIKFRLHRIWTPIGITMIVLDWIIYFVLSSQTCSGISEIMTYCVNDSFYYVLGFGLLLTFIDLSALKKHSYYFLTMATVFCLVISIPNVMGTMASLGEGNPEWTGFADLMWFMSGPVLLYIIYKRFREGRPSKKEAGMGIAKFLAALIIAVIAFSIAASATEQNSWFARWAHGEKPEGGGVTCAGSLCGQAIYKSPYDGLCANLQGYTGRNFANLIQLHELITCSFAIDTDTGMSTISCMKNIQKLGGRSATFQVFACGQGGNSTK